MLVQAKVVWVVEVVTRDGRGTGDDPCRRVVRYFADDGALLATNDPLARMPYENFVAEIDPREFIEYFKWRVGPTMMDARTDRAIEVFSPNGNPVIYDMREKRFRRGAC